MKILIRLQGQSWLKAHEALSLAFALAAFEHTIQLQLTASMLALLLANPEGKLAKMLTALPLYDMPPARLDPDAKQQLSDWQTHHPNEPVSWFDSLILDDTLPTEAADFDLALDL